MDANSTAILILLGSFPLMVSLCFPIVYAVALSSVFCFLYQEHNLTTIRQQVAKGISSSGLMVVPFFITMGCLMGSGGTSEKLIALANACVDRIRDDMVVIDIVASCFFGGISGSATTDTASLGSILIPVMADQGYDDSFSTTVTITSSCEGLLVPPSYNMVIYATTVGGVSVGNLFLAEYIPGALPAVSLMIGSYIISIKRNCPKGEKLSIINLIKQLSVSFWALVAALIVMLDVVGGVFIATESAAVTVIYSLIVSVFVYRGLGQKGIWRVLGDYVDTLPIIIILTATSSIFELCLTQLHVPVPTVNAITGVTSNPIILTLLLDLILLVLGCTMGMVPIVLIVTPILLPIVTSIDLDPIQFGIMVVLNCGIGLLAPPTGAVFSIGSAVVKVPMERVIKVILPFYLCMVITLLLTIFVPVVSMRLFNVLGGSAK